jgi:hypothetical protein
VVRPSPHELTYTHALHRSTRRSTPLVLSA